MAAVYDERLDKYAIIDRSTGLVQTYIKADNAFEAMAEYRASSED